MVKPCICFGIAPPSCLASIWGCDLWGCDLWGCNLYGYQLLTFKKLYARTYSFDTFLNYAYEPKIL